MSLYLRPGSIQLLAQVCDVGRADTAASAHDFGPRGAPARLARSHGKHEQGQACEHVARGGVAQRVHDGQHPEAEPCERHGPHEPPLLRGGLLLVAA